MISLSNISEGNSDQQPNLTPLLDIIFIVMVFLLLTANVELKSLDIDLPTTETKILQTTAANPITLNLMATSPQWAIDGTSSTDWQQFTTQVLSLVKMSPQKPIVIGADKNASVEDILSLLAFLQKNQIKVAQLLMEEGS